jgi:hypothetical protein
LERSDNPGITALLGINNAESVGKLANSFRVENASRYLTQFQVGGDVQATLVNSLVKKLTEI